MQVGAEVRGRIEPRRIAKTVRLRRDDTRAQLEVPEHVELAAGIIVVEADESHERRVDALARDDVIDEPLPMPRMDNLALGRQAIRARSRWPHRRRLRIEPRGFEDERLEVCARAGGVVEAVAAADGAQLVAPKLAEQGREASGQVVGKLRNEAVLAAGYVAHLAAEEPAEIEEAPRGDHGEDRGDGRHRGRR